MRRRPKPRYVVAWALWIVAFLVIEGAALLNRDPGADTLSELVWVAVSVPVVWWVLAGFLVWLTVHFLLGGRHDDPRSWFRRKDDR
jgi:ribose/xylose/arabinose/galactoside ABC-type transport system permease subunit